MLDGYSDKHLFDWTIYTMFDKNKTQKDVDDRISHYANDLNDISRSYYNANP